MITNEKLRNIISDSKVAGYSVKLRDIAYVMLCTYVEDCKDSYKMIFGKDEDSVIEKYAQSRDIMFLKKYMENNVLPKRIKEGKKEDISFEENKEYMLKLKRDTETAMGRGEIEKKDALKILTDISVKLNDKFQVSEEKKEQIVVVNQKYNEICPYCSHEISVRQQTE